MKQLAGFNSFLGLRFFHVDLHVPAVTQHMATDTTSEAYNTGANQVGEMFANYNLIAAIASFFATIGKIYESKIHTLCRTCLRRTWSYVCLFHN
jgi:maltose/moltooligosaccharide transporter